MIEIHKSFIWCFCLKKSIKNCVKSIQKSIYINLKKRRFKYNIFSKYATNLKTTISQRSLSNLGLLILLFKFNNFSFLIDIIDNIITYSPLVRITSTELQPMSVQYTGHVFSVCITWQRYWTAIGWSSDHVIQTYPLYYQIYLLKEKNY